MDPFIGQITLFAGNFAPRGWAFCHGQLLDISSNSALFSILGTTYGGDGRSNFALPDLRGRVPVQQGSGPGLTARQLGEKGGSETVTLTEAQMPSHNHTVNCHDGRGTGNNTPVGSVIAGHSDAFQATGRDLMLNVMINPTGGGQSHPNVQPYLGLNYIIALVGIFPSRN